jgi:16S rRNA processing protein RimM
VIGEADPAWPEDAIEVGRIVDAWGVKGWVKVEPYASDPQALFSSRRWFLKPAESPTGPRGASVSAVPAMLHVTVARQHGDVVVASARELEDRNAAEALRGVRVFVSRASFPTPDEDEFYWVDLIGLEVVNREQQPLGTVIGLIDTGPHCVLRISPGRDAEERLIPFVGAYIDEVNLKDRRIVVDWGLDY